MHVNRQIRPELTAIEGAGPNNWIALQIIGVQIIASLAALEAALGVILMYHSVPMSVGPVALAHLYVFLRLATEGYD